MRVLLGLERVLCQVFSLSFTLVRLVSGLSFVSPRRDSYEFTDLLHQCKCLNSIKKLHAQIMVGGYRYHPFLAAKLVGKYTEHSNSSMEDARRVFDHLQDRDLFCWNMVIQGYSNVGPSVVAVNLYNEMRLNRVAANRYTYPFVLKACASMEDMKKGQPIHGHIIKSGLDLDLFVGNSLVHFYAKCKEIENAKIVFDGMHEKDIVSWNALISGYTGNGHVTEALFLFRVMLRHTVCAPDIATLVGILPACAQTADIQQGMWVHAYIIKLNMEVNCNLGSGLISMYAHCGRLKAARIIFDGISDKNVAVWNSMIWAYGMHGHAEEALIMFSQFVKMGLNPDGILFLCLLSTCSHAGMVAKGREIFERMRDFGVEKTEEHYACMVDLLGRAGLLDEAVELVNTMPMKARKSVYGALVGACRKHNNLVVAEEVSKKLIVLDPENAGRYIILAKMYEDQGCWEDAARLRKVLKEKKIRKPLGCSAIEVNYVRHTFGVQDEFHPFKEQIFDMLEKLARPMEENMMIFDVIGAV